MTTWSAEDIRSQATALLPDGWALLCEQGVHGWWSATISEPSGSELVPVWQGSSADERIALFDAYGWLWLRSKPIVESNSPWVRRRELSRESVTNRVARGLDVPDPEDLDPAEVAAVYETLHGKR